MPLHGHIPCGPNRIGAITHTYLAVKMQDTLINGPLGKSGFFAAFSLILLSEIGDKTFFIAALLVCVSRA